MSPVRYLGDLKRAPHSKYVDAFLHFTLVEMMESETGNCTRIPELSIPQRLST